MKYGVRFFNLNISYVVRKKFLLRKWVVSAIEKEGKKAGDLNFILCDDEYLAELNFKYLKHKTLTDILTFPYHDETDLVSGDIYISLPRIKENAEKFQQEPEDELHRVMIHGVLHLVGYNDSSIQQKAEMSAREDFYLKQHRRME